MYSAERNLLLIFARPFDLLEASTKGLIPTSRSMLTVYANMNWWGRRNEGPFAGPLLIDTATETMHRQWIAGHQEIPRHLIEMISTTEGYAKGSIEEALAFSSLACEWPHVSSAIHLRDCLRQLLATDFDSVTAVFDKNIWLEFQTTPMALLTLELLRAASAGQRVRMLHVDGTSVLGSDFGPSAEKSEIGTSAPTWHSDEFVSEIRRLNSESREARTGRRLFWADAVRNGGWWVRNFGGKTTTHAIMYTDRLHWFGRGNCAVSGIRGPSDSPTTVLVAFVNALLRDGGAAEDALAAHFLFRNNLSTALGISESISAAAARLSELWVSDHPSPYAYALIHAARTNGIEVSVLPHTTLPGLVDPRLYTRRYLTLPDDIIRYPYPSIGEFDWHPSRETVVSSGLPSTHRFEQSHAIPQGLVTTWRWTKDTLSSFKLKDRVLVDVSPENAARRRNIRIGLVLDATGFELLAFHSPRPHFLAIAKAAQVVGHEFARLGMTLELVLRIKPGTANEDAVAAAISSAVSALPETPNCRIVLAPSVQSLAAFSRTIEGALAGAPSSAWVELVRSGVPVLSLRDFDWNVPRLDAILSEKLVPSWTARSIAECASDREFGLRVLARHQQHLLERPKS